jgi:phage major head subunit gpT-like protein
MQLTPQNLEFLFKQFQADYQRGFGKRATIWQNFAERIPSSTETNTYGWLAELPGFREWIGPRIMRNIAARTYAITNKDWEDSFALSRNKIEDDQFGLYSRSSELLGDAAARLWDDLCIDALQLGNGVVCCDGQFFFDSDHPVDLDDAGAGTYSNLATAKPLNPANIQVLKTQMAGFKGESGKSLEIVPDLLLVPTALEGDAFAAVQANMYAQPVLNVAGNQNVAAAAVPNPIPALGQIRVVSSPRLDNAPTVYYLMSTQRLKPIILQVRKEPEIVQRTDPAMDNVFHRKEFEYGADARGAAGYGLPFTAIRAVTV